MTRKGFSIVELLVTAIIFLIAVGAIVTVLTNLGRTQVAAVTIPSNQDDVDSAVNALLAQIRRAPLCDPDAGCTGVADAALQSAGSSSVTVYTTSSGAKATFSTQNGALKRASDTKTLTLVDDGIEIGFEYLLSSERTYTMATSADAASWTKSVSNADLPAIIAVRVTTTVTRSGITRVQSSVVRLRNSPKKQYTTS